MVESPFCVYQFKTNVPCFHILSEPVEEDQLYKEAGFDEGEFSDGEEGVSYTNYTFFCGPLLLNKSWQL